MTGKEELAALLAEIAEAVDGNPCGMGDGMMRSLAEALRTVWKAKVPKTYSRESAATALGISVRQLQRDAAACGVRFKREGHGKVWLTEDDIKAIREYRDNEK